MEIATTAARPLNNPDFAPSGGEASTSAAEAPVDGTQFWGADGFTFADFLDIINPLQHLPIIGPIYRAITGDTISPAARIAGGILFGGPVGLIAAVANQAVDEATGRDLGEHAIAMVTGEADDEAETAVADGAPPPAVQAVALADNSARPVVAPSPTVAARLATPPAITRARRAPTPVAAPPAIATGAIPRLSPRAFDALVRELGATPAPSQAAPAWVPGELPTLAGAGGERRRAALELHHLLAERHGEQASLARRETGVRESRRLTH